jgi:hypothetical protein
MPKSEEFGISDPRYRVLAMAIHPVQYMAPIFHHSATRPAAHGLPASNCGRMTCKPDRLATIAKNGVALPGKQDQPVDADTDIIQLWLGHAGDRKLPGRKMSLVR